MEEGTPLYCENGECRVLMFTAEPVSAVEGTGHCPGCGQFGRKKGKQ
jgi:hypothetical protein